MANTKKVKSTSTAKKKTSTKKASSKSTAKKKSDSKYVGKKQRENSFVDTYYNAIMLCYIFGAKCCLLGFLRLGERALLGKMRELVDAGYFFLFHGIKRAG